MTVLLWIALPVLISVGSALIALLLMQHRLEVHLARERRSLAEARAALEAQKSAVEELGRLRQQVERTQATTAHLTAQPASPAIEPPPARQPRTLERPAEVDPTKDLGALAEALAVFRGVSPEGRVRITAPPRQVGS